MSGKTVQRGELLRPSEVALLFRVHSQTVSKWARAGKLTYVRTLGGHRRFLRSEVEKLMLELGIPAPSDPAA